VVSLLLAELATATMEREMPAALSTYARIEDGLWHPVIEQRPDGCVLAETGFAFDALWSQPAPGIQTGSTLFRSWDRLSSPLPDREIPCWAYAFTYKEHNRDMHMSGAFRFPKAVPAEIMREPISHREHLDFEGEIGVLLRRDHPDRFGFIMINDLTDRGLQVHGFDKRNPGPGFTRAKSFEGALRVGPLLAIGRAEDWPLLQIEVRLNGSLRQVVRAENCLLTPERLHAEFTAETRKSDLLLVATGTDEGTVFRVPSFWQKIGLLLGNGFSFRRAQDAWLRRLDFMQPGDTLEMSSPGLGVASATVRN